jgi:hypothetical protein
MHVPVPGVIELVIKQRMGDNRMFNVIHVGNNDFPDTIPVIDYAASVLAAWTNRVMPRISNKVQLVEVTARDLGPEEGDQVVLPATNVFGADISQVEPAQVAMLVQKITALGGRARRGRLYLAGIPDAALEGEQGVIVANWLADTQLAFDSFLSDIQAIGGTSDTQMFVVSRFLGTDAGGNPIPRAQGIKTAITRLLCASSVATQRDRNRR